MRADGEQRVEGVLDAGGAPRGQAERGHERVLAGVFGEVAVGRVAYRARGCCNLHLADGVLNLPAGRHSHGLRRLAAVESSRGSFDEAGHAIERATGRRLGKRQVQQLAARGAQDFEAFYAQRQPATPRTSRRSTPSVSPPPPRTGTCWWSPATAREW